MALYKAQVIFNMNDGLPKNASTNTLYFDADDDTVLPVVTDKISEFFSLAGTLMSSLIDDSNCYVEWYRMSDPTPRQIVYREFLSNFTVSTTAGPTEIALVVSYQAAKVSGLPQNRRRGRFFIGPVEMPQGDRPTLSQINAIAGAAQDLLDDSNAATTWTWAQYSETNGIGTNVDNGWVDNEWDTQRRRGRDATNRSTFTTP